ncbi:uncharacterized protein LOC143840927 [Paroedura picta]|uniref:uncharacterized protein LOC143840927 n=1 Tax=Paroedura picta TaxID=143630 RepID=UPI0040569DE7
MTMSGCQDTRRRRERRRERNAHTVLDAKRWGGTTPPPAPAPFPTQTPEWAGSGSAGRSPQSPQPPFVAPGAWDSAPLAVTRKKKPDCAAASPSLPPRRPGIRNHFARQPSTHPKPARSKAKAAAALVWPPRSQGGQTLVDCGRPSKSRERNSLSTNSLSMASEVPTCQFSMDSLNGSTLLMWTVTTCKLDHCPS